MENNAQEEVRPEIVEVDKTNAEDKLLKIVIEDFNSSREYVKNTYQKTWHECWKLYNNIRVKHDYKGVSDDFVPETFTIIESVKANIAGGKPKFNYLPLRDDQKQDTDVLNALVDFYWDQNRMSQKVALWVQDMLVMGNGILGVSWQEEGPFIENIPLQDFFVDPTATNMANPSVPGYPKYAGHRFLTSIEELKNAKMVNPKTGDMEDMYKNLDKIEEDRTSDDNTDKEDKERVLGSTLGEDAAKKQVEVIVYYTRKKKILIANRKTIIYNGDNPYAREASTEKEEYEVEQPVMDDMGQPLLDDFGEPITETAIEEVQREIPAIEGFLPYAILRDYVDNSLFYAKGDVEIIKDRQEALNDVSSQKSDNLKYALNNMWQLDPQFKHLAEQIESLPGAVFPIPRGALSPIEKQMVGSEADIEMARIKDEMRRATAADEVIQGVTANKGRVTATEVQANINQASQRFATKLTTLEQEGYAQLGRIIFKMMQIFLDQEVAVRIIGQDGVYWKDYDPAEYLGDYEPVVQLEATTKTVKAEEGQKYAQVWQMFASSPVINQTELTRIMAEKYLDLDEQDVEALLSQPPMPPMMPGMDLSGGMPTEIDENSMTPSTPLPSSPIGSL